MIEKIDSIRVFSEWLVPDVNMSFLSIAFHHSDISPFDLSFYVQLHIGNIRISRLSTTTGFNSLESIFRQGLQLTCF